MDRLKPGNGSPGQIRRYSTGTSARNQQGNRSRLSQRQRCRQGGVTGPGQRCRPRDSLRHRTAGRISGLGLLDADNRISGLDEGSMTALQNLSLPVMDAYRSDDYRRLQEAQRRRRLAGDNAQYFPTRVPGVALYRPDEPNRVSQRIRGWIDKYIAGITPDTF